MSIERFNRHLDMLAIHGRISIHLENELAKQDRLINSIRERVRACDDYPGESCDGITYIKELLSLYDNSD